jgi:hypothetical protein
MFVPQMNGMPWTRAAVANAMQNVRANVGGAQGPMPGNPPYGAMFMPNMPMMYGYNEGGPVAYGYNAQASSSAANNPPRGGGGCGGGACPMPQQSGPWDAITPEMLLQALWWQRGGTVAEGMACPPRPAPRLMVDPNGCTNGWLQCKMPLAANALDVEPGETVIITVKPPRSATPRQFIYTGPSSTFEIVDVSVGRIGLQVGEIPADVYASSANAVDLSVDWLEFNANTPLDISVRNFSNVQSSFRSAVIVTADR